MDRVAKQEPSKTSMINVEKIRKKNKTSKIKRNDRKRQRQRPRERERDITGNNRDAHVLVSINKNIDGVLEDLVVQQQSGYVLKHYS